MGFISRFLRMLTASAGSNKNMKAAKSKSLKSTSSGRSKQKTSGNTSLDDGWLTIDSPHFFGQAYLSPDKRWVVGCNDSDGAGTGGHRESGFGKVVLVDYLTGKVVNKFKKFARPFSAAVSDAGNFIIHDAGFGSTLKSELVSVGADGIEMFRRHFKSNIYNIGLSDCGRYASVQTANAPGEDGNILEVLDLKAGATVFSVKPDNGWSESYTFKVDEHGALKVLIVEYRGIGHFSFSSAGVFLDEDAYQTARLCSGDFTHKISAARDLLKKSPTPDNANKALNAVSAALSEGANERNDWAAIAYRVRGESYELLGKHSEALNAYEQALSINSKIGVQKRVIALRKRIGEGDSRQRL